MRKRRGGLNFPTRRRPPTRNTWRRPEEGDAVLADRPRQPRGPTPLANAAVPDDPPADDEHRT